VFRPLQNPNGKVVLITSAAGGLGRALAFQFAALGAKLVLWDLDETTLAATAAEIRALFPLASPEEGALFPLCGACDVSGPSEVHAEAERVLALVGPVSAVVGNEGTVSGQALLSTPDRKVELTFAVNAL
jgi:NAD(P)-dependent dehydrogenase (short-subunit alcohol dehydrogenase family)